MAMLAFPRLEKMWMKTKKELKDTELELLSDKHK